MKLAYPAIFDPWEDGAGYTVEFPDLPGCVTEGKSITEALDMAEDAASGWILDELEDGKQTPVASNALSIIPPDGGFVSMVSVDIDAYAAKYGTQAVRVNVSLPAWLKARAEENSLNLSKVLQEALLSRGIGK